MTFFTGNDTVFAQFADLHRHGATVNTEVIRKGLAVIGNREGSGFILLGLHEQEGHQLFPGGSVGGNLDFLVEKEILRGDHPKEIEDHPAVKGAGTGAAGCDTPAVDEHYLAVLRCGYTDR